MAKEKRFFIVFLIFSLITASLLAGSVKYEFFTSNILGRDLGYSVYLPDDYNSSNLYYPIIYILHGHGGNQYQWVNEGKIVQIVDELIKNGELPSSIIVMPATGNNWYVDRREKIESMFFQEFMPYIENTYRVIKSRDARVIGGQSMGGYGALRYSMLHPELFSVAILLSPAVYDPVPPKNSAAITSGVFGDPFDPNIWKSLNYPSLFMSYLMKGMPVAMYIASGDDDELFIELHSTQLYESLRNAGLPAELRIVDGGHDWEVWIPTMREGLKYAGKYLTQPK